MKNINSTLNHNYNCFTQVNNLEDVAKWKLSVVKDH